jgi:SAM-dependent methyltransferase
MLGTMLCKYEDFFTDWFRRSAEALKIEAPGFDAHRADRIFHRKNWEFVTIVQALDERGMLVPGKKGCGFAVGQEPLASLFAARGVLVLGTDLPDSADQVGTLSATEWASAGQHAAAVDGLYRSEFLELPDFRRMVDFRPVDMRDLRLPWDETFDFLWSSCSIEHLGSLEAGMDFVKQSMDLLKPGGVAVYTTEFNVSSNDETLTSGPFVVYRKCDIEKLDYELRKIRCGLSRCDFFAGDDQLDIEYDSDPFNAQNYTRHLKLDLAGFIATSMILIVRKGGP